MTPTTPAQHLQRVKDMIDTLLKGGMIKQAEDVLLLMDTYEFFRDAVAKQIPRDATAGKISVAENHREVSTQQ